MPRLLLALTSGLLAALILNLVVFDDLRTDASADVVGTFLAPQHLPSILAGLLAVVLLAMRHRWAPRVAVTVVWIEIVAFLSSTESRSRSAPPSPIGATAWATRSSGSGSR